MQVAAPGTQEAMDAAIEQLKKGNIDFVFKCGYIGVNPEDSSDIIDLHAGYIENKNTSYPTFHYMLLDIITVVE